MKMNRIILNTILTMRKEDKIPEQLVIRKSKFRIEDVAYIIGILLIIVFFENDITKLILLTFICGIVSYSIKRRFDNKELIIIDKEGITLQCDDVKCIQRNKFNGSIQWKNKCIQWKDIRYAYVNQTKAYNRSRHLYGRGGYYIIKWFHIETTSSRLTVKITDFSYNLSLVNRCINHFSGMKITDN